WCSWLDSGMFIQNVMLAARGSGLHSCPQAAFNPYGDVVRQVLGLDAGREVVCGMALGHEDADAAENRLRTAREPVSGFATFLEE
ncbi:MAG: nitroreductase family protein, partial [Alphaproteobacteria bacterium]